MDSGTTARKTRSLHREAELRWISASALLHLNSTQLCPSQRDVTRMFCSLTPSGPRFSNGICDGPVELFNPIIQLLSEVFQKHVSFGLSCRTCVEMNLNNHLSACSHVEVCRDIAFPLLTFLIISAAETLVWDLAKFTPAQADRV